MNVTLTREQALQVAEARGFTLNQRHIEAIDGTFYLIADHAIEAPRRLYLNYVEKASQWDHLIVDRGGDHGSPSAEHAGKVFLPARTHRDDVSGLVIADG